MTESNGGYLDGIPGSVVVRAQSDMEYALRLLHQDTRQDALNELDMGLTEEAMVELNASLDAIAGMSFESAIQQLRNAGIACLG